MQPIDDSSNEVVNLADSSQATLPSLYFFDKTNRLLSVEAMNCLSINTNENSDSSNNYNITTTTTTTIPTASPNYTTPTSTTIPAASPNYTTLTTTTIPAATISTSTTPPTSTTTASINGDDNDNDKNDNISEKSELSEIIKEKSIKTKKKLKSSIRVDITGARSCGPIIERGVEFLNWRVYKAPLHSKNKLVSQIYWVGFNEEISVPRGSYVSHFPGLCDICNKRNLGVILNRLKNLFSEEFSFHPNTWLLPEEYHNFCAYVEAHLKQDTYYIIKPADGSQGEGIYIMKDVRDKLFNYNKPHIAQQYISNPLLHDAYKFDIRLYVLLLDIDPLEAYVCRTGMARYCTTPYSKPSQKNIHKAFMHLTNYSLNKRSETYVHTDEPDTGSKRVLLTVLNELQDKGIASVDLIWDKIDNVVAKTLIAMKSDIKLALSYSIRQGNLKSIHSCFQILGFDLIIDNNLDVHLLEVNSHPSLSIDFEQPVSDKPGHTIFIESQVDLEIKLLVVSDALKIVRRRQKLGPGVSINFPGSYVQILPNLLENYGYLQCLDPIEQIFEHFVKRDNIFMGHSAFRNFLRTCQLVPEIVSTAEADLLFLKATRSFTSYESNMINFHQFYQLFLQLAQNKQANKLNINTIDKQSEAVQQLITQLVEKCRVNMKNC